MLQQVHLKGPFHSNRAVQVRELDLYAHEANLLSAAKSLGEGAVAFEIKKTEWRMGAQLMIVAISEPTPDVTEKTKFTKVDQATLQEKMATYFTAKDVAVLEQLYRQFHDLSGAEVEAIVGKMQPVSEG